MHSVLRHSRPANAEPGYTRTLRNVLPDTRFQRDRSARVSRSTRCDALRFLGHFHAGAQRIVRPWARAYTASMSEEPAAGASQASPADPNADCPRCLKPQALCVCEGIAPIDNKVSLLILQHPQEQDRELGTARLTVLHFKDALLKIGLSWPSLTRILGRPADPQRWAILYLGSVKAAAVLPDRDIVVVNK